MPIGIFDSGVGGFTILYAVNTLIPTQDIIYFADQAYVPYAKKSTDFLQERGKKITKFLVSKGCHTIVVACNTATVAIISFLRKSFPQLVFVGVEPAIKPAARGEGDMLVLATKHTLESQRLEYLIDRYARKKKIHLKDMPSWVDLAEQGQVQSKEATEDFKTALEGVDRGNITDVVLACTHYPYFKKIIHNELPQATIHESSQAVAQRVAVVHEYKQEEKGEIAIYTNNKHSRLATNIHDLLPIQAKIKSMTL